MKLQFTSAGLLIEGIHLSTWDEFIELFGWNSHRRRLIRGLAEAVELLAKAGCQRILICGSFVTDKDYPGDIDVLYDLTGMDEDKLDPVFFEFARGRAEQKARFGCEFFPSNMIERSSGKPFLEFFQTDRNDVPQGIIEITITKPGTEPGD